LSSAERIALKATLGIPAERPVVVYLGLLTDYQGTDKLLYAAAELRRRSVDVHFLIMGYPGVGRYHQMAMDLGLGDWVTFTGRIAYEQAPQHLALGDIAVAPKLSATEGSGKILNYMAMELPTVAFDVPVSREFLDDLGTYAEPGSPHSLADSMQSLLADPALAHSLGQRLRQRAAEHYSWEQAGLHIVSVYDRLIYTAQTPQAQRSRGMAASRSQAEQGEGEQP
jgi:glycosyltransferase involved in cell wall biosynthesis